MSMHLGRYLGLATLILGFSAMPLALQAQEGDSETMETIEEESELLSLPDEASDEGHENAAFGLDTANEARSDGRAFGEGQAESAREHRGEAGREIGEEARGGAGRPE